MTDLKCPVCAGPMKFRDQEFRFHAYVCLDEKCAGTSKCDHDCCRIMAPERAFDLIVSENHISKGHRQERILQLLKLVHQHGREGR